VRAAQLLERGFGNGLSWLRPSLGTVDSLAPIDATPPNLRDEMCGGKRKRPATDEDETSLNVAAGNSSSGETGVTFYASGLQAPMPKASELLLADVPVREPMVVYTGPKKTGAALIAAVATDSDKQTTKRSKRTRVAKKPDAAGEAKSAETRTAGKPEKPAAAKPKVQHASAKPDAAAGAKSADKPAAAKPAAAKPAAAKPAATAKPKPDAKPAS